MPPNVGDAAGGAGEDGTADDEKRKAKAEFVEKQRRTEPAHYFVINLLLSIVVACIYTASDKILVPVNLPNEDVTLLAGANSGRLEAGTRDEAAINARFNAVWPEMKEKLCPRMIPNATVGYRAFQLARKLLRMFPATGRDSSKQKSHAHAYDTIHEACSLIPNEKHSEAIIYMKNWKAGNNQICGWVDNICQEEANFSFSKDSLESSLKLVREMKRRPLELGKDVCIVTAVRDPVERFLSGYNEIECRAREHPGHLNETHSLLFSHYQYGQKIRFETFIADYIEGLGQDAGDWDRLQLGHIWSMSGLLQDLASQGAWLTAYLPSIANLTYEWPEFIASNCPDAPALAKKAPMKLMGEHESSSDPFGFYAAAKAVWADQGNSARALCALNVMDYACWEEVPEGVPLLCKDVFSKIGFVREIAVC